MHLKILRTMQLTRIRTEITVISADFELEKSICARLTAPIHSRSDVKSPVKHDESVSAELKSYVFIRCVFFVLFTRSVFFPHRRSLLTRKPVAVYVVRQKSQFVSRFALFDLI